MKWSLSNQADCAALCRALLEQTQDAIIVLDRDGNVRFWNRGAEVLFGYGSAEILGHSLDLVIPEKLRHAHQAGYRQAMASGLLRHEGRILTTRAQSKYGTRLYVDFSFGLLKNASGAATGALAIGRDATARHAEQTARQALADKLRHQAG